MPSETLVLLPGLLCDHRLFSPQIEKLRATYDIVVQQLVANYSIDGMVKCVLRRVEASKFSVAGLLMGGIVVMAMVGIVITGIFSDNTDGPNLKTFQ